ncbi:MAG TPA: sulfite exporter TauE/SafE family protein [Gaiellaceae bacterium]|nr:sulfite exporter TauE/SafE family protein [Gaiellaceae bacterium]
MSISTALLAILLGLAAGVLAGFFGVGGGILFVPTLVGLGLSQLDAEATSLLAILPTVAAGTWRQQRYGNVRPRSALVLGLASIAGVAAGVQIATSLPEDTLRRLFALLLLGVAAQLAWRSRRPAPYPSDP